MIATRADTSAFNAGHSLTLSPVPTKDQYVEAHKVLRSFSAGTPRGKAGEGFMAKLLGFLPGSNVTGGHHGKGYDLTMLLSFFLLTIEVKTRLLKAGKQVKIDLTRQERESLKLPGSLVLCQTFLENRGVFQKYYCVVFDGNVLDKHLEPWDLQFNFTVDNEEGLEKRGALNAGDLSPRGARRAIKEHTKRLAR